MNTQILEVVSGRSNPMIDPSLHIWGWEVPVYLFLGGLVAGLMILVPLLELKTRARSQALRHVPLLAAILISLGMGALFLDLEHPLHVYRFYLTFQPTSPMSWGAWVLIGVYPILMLSWLGGLSETNKLPLPLQRLHAAATAHRGLILEASVVLGVALGAYTGLLLGTMAARPPWSSAALGPLFLVSGLSTGAALLLLIGAEAERARLLVRWDTAAILGELGILAAMLLGFQSGGLRGQLAADALLGGAWTPWFWSLVVVTGLAVPLALNMLELRRRIPMTLLSPALVLVGGLSLRFVLVAAGQDLSFAMLP